VGAVVTAFLFDLGTLLISTLIAWSSDSPYGTAASVLALLAWVYYSAQVFFFGAELTRIFATTYGGGIIPVHRRLWRRPQDERSIDAPPTPADAPATAAVAARARARRADR
jgi:membrane protein